MRKASAQARLEDNPLVYVLDGIIIPPVLLGLMRISALRASNLNLLTAFSPARSPPFERCNQDCAMPGIPSRLVTRGHMYLHQGQHLCRGLHAHT